jgi:outer membrane murein-binding lipoprotein Lpp
MISMKIRTVAVRVAAVAALGAGLSACATPVPNYDEHFAAINGRLDTMSGRIDSLDVRVQEAIQRADAAGQAANTANQRIDQLQQMPPPMMPRSPRG